MKKKNIFLLEAIAVMVGAIIGAGILGLPYVFSKVGFWAGSLILLIVTGIMALMKLMYGEVTLRTKGNHQLLGYTKIYLGNISKHLVSFLLVLHLNGALLAYFVGQGDVINAMTGIPVLWSSLIFYILFSILLFIGLAIIKRMELLMSGIIILIVFIIGFLSIKHISLGNFTNFDLTNSFNTFGVLLFACSGSIAIPEIRLLLKRKEFLMRRAILFGVLIPPVVYFLFSFLVLSVTGTNVTEIATIGLGQVIGSKMILVANLFAFFTMGTSFLTIGLALKETYQFDYKVTHFFSWLLAVMVPLGLLFLIKNSFTYILGLVGGLAVAGEGIAMVLIYFKARKLGKRKPEYVIPEWLGNGAGIVLIIAFILSIGYTLMEVL